MSGGSGGGEIIIDSISNAIGVSESERIELRRIKDSVTRRLCSFSDRLFVCRILWRILKQ